VCVKILIKQISSLNKYYNASFNFGRESAAIEFIREFLVALLRSKLDAQTETEVD
jgi:hypothetical protein